MLKARWFCLSVMFWWYLCLVMHGILFWSWGSKKCLVENRCLEHTRRELVMLLALDVTPENESIIEAVSRPLVGFTQDPSRTQRSHINGLQRGLYISTPTKTSYDLAGANYSAVQRKQKSIVRDALDMAAAGYNIYFMSRNLFISLPPNLPPPSSTTPIFSLLPLPPLPPINPSPTSPPQLAPMTLDSPIFDFPCPPHRLLPVPNI